MKLHQRTWLTLAAAAVFLPVGVASAASISVDGDISDWGVSGLGSDIAEYSGVAGKAWEFTYFEDDGHLAPGGGGQNYDVEFIALHIDEGSNTLYGVFMSGQRSDNGVTKYSPGDIFLKALDSAGNTVTFGIEVGGGAGDSGLQVVHKGDDGTTYNMQSNGYTDGTTPTRATPYKAGELVRDPGFEEGMPYDGNEVQIVEDLAAQSLGFVSEYIYLQDGTLAQHAVIEFALNLDQLDLGPDGEILTARWGPGCGNDTGAPGPSSSPVPEPTAALLMFAGLLTLRISGVVGKR